MIESTQATEARIDEPQVVVGGPGHFVNVDITGDVDAPRWPEQAEHRSRRLATQLADGAQPADTPPDGPPSDAPPLPLPLGGRSGITV